MKNLNRVIINRKWLVVAVLLFTMVPGFAHDNHQEKQDSTEQATTDTGLHQHEEADADHQEVDADHHLAEVEQKITADLDDFPSLHPLIVHFAIVMLIVGALLQLINIYFLKKEIAWIAFALVAGGILTAYLAGNTFHPHTYGLSDHAKLVLEQHDLWADRTLYLGIAGAVLQGLNLFFLQRKRWTVVVVAIILTAAAYSVAQAGHYGSQLVHIEGVGPQGNFLEIEEDHQH